MAMVFGSQVLAYSHFCLLILTLFCWMPVPSILKGKEFHTFVSLTQISLHIFFSKLALFTFCRATVDHKVDTGRDSTAMLALSSKKKKM
jgi:hypothetical protein